MMRKIINDIKKDETLKRIVIIFIILKIIFIAIGVSGYLIPEQYTYRARITGNIMLNPWAQYDSIAYLRIAEFGYDTEFNEGIGTYGFYPLYPALIKIFSFLGFDLSAFFVANMASLLAVILLYYLVKEETNKKTAYRTFLYIMLFPTAYFFTAMYTESLFLLLSLATFYFAKKENWLLAGLSGLLLSMTRMQGILIFPPILYMYFSRIKFDFRRFKPSMIFVFLIPLGLLIVLSYHFALTGDALTQFHTQDISGRNVNFPWVAVIDSFELMFSATSPVSIFYYIFTNYIFVLFLGIAYFSYKYLRKEYFIYIALSILLPTLSSTLQAITRFDIVIFPAFIVLAIAREKKNGILIDVMYIIFIIILVALTIWHTNGGFVVSGFN